MARGRVLWALAWGWFVGNGVSGERTWANFRLEKTRCRQMWVSISFVLVVHAGIFRDLIVCTPHDFLSDVVQSPYEQSTFYRSRDSIVISFIIELVFYAL